MPMSFGSSIVEPGKSGSNTAAIANSIDQCLISIEQSFVNRA